MKLVNLFFNMSLRAINKKGNIPCNKFTKSLPNLSPHRKSSLRYSNSDSDLDKISNKGEKKPFYLSAKSEVSLKTISAVRKIKKNNHSESQELLSSKMEASEKRRMSERSDILSGSLGSPTTTDSALGGPFDPSNIRIPIVGYEIVEERSRFTV